MTQPPTDQLPPGPLRVERRDDGVAVITLDLPDRRNAMTEELTRAWAAALPALAADDGLRCVVVTGAGSAFCAGGDVGWIAAVPDAGVEELRGRMLPFYRTWLAVRELEVPTIAAVNGAAVGAGLCLALACDLRYAAESAPLSAPFTALGMHPGMAASWLLPQVVGLSAARELLLTGRVVAGQEAVRLGLVNRVFPAVDLLDEVLAVAAQIAQTAPVAARLTTMALRDGHATFNASVHWEMLAQPITMATADLQEGLRARAERRAPRFTGR